MPEVGRETGDLALDIESVAVPSQQRADGESMAQVVQARAAGIRRTSQADLSGQLHERPVQRPVRDPGSTLGEEEARAERMGAEAIALRRVLS